MKQKQNPVKNTGKVLRNDAIQSRSDDLGEDSYGGDSRKPPPRTFGLPGPATSPDRDNWAVTPLNKGKAPYKDVVPAWWKPGALHHQISKDKLEAIGKQLFKDCVSKESTVAKPALKFWYLCCHLAGPDVRDALGGSSGHEALNPIRLLWNMPINIALGPLTPANDPGRLFDPDTEPAPGGDGARRLTEVSTKLAELERAWDQANAENDGAGNFTGDMWRQLTKCLSAAREAAHRQGGRGGNLLYPPLDEQWLQDSSDRGVRKGLIRYVGAKQGKTLFQAACGDAEKIPDLSKANWVIENTCTVILDGKKAELTVTVNPTTVKHICERHTLTFFDFAPANAKLINAFWKGSTTFAKMRLFVEHDLLPFVTEALVRELKRYKAADLEQSAEICLYQVPNGPNDTLFVRANVQMEDPTHISAKVKTIAPDGPQAVGFLRAELLEIGKYIDD